MGKPLKLSGRDRLRIDELDRLKWYHGGPTGLTEILPPRKTGAEDCVRRLVNDMIRDASADGSIDKMDFHRMKCACLAHDPDRVFITQDVAVARLYATGRIDSGCGAVYEVEPRGAIELDEWIPSLSFSCDSADIIRVHSFVAERDWRQYRRIVERKYPQRTIPTTPEDELRFRSRMSEEVLRRMGADELMDFCRDEGVHVLIPEMM